MKIESYDFARPYTKSDSVPFPEVNGAKQTAIYVGTKGSTGTAVCAYADGSTVTFVGLLAGTIYPIKCLRINDGTTDISNIVVLYQI